MTAPSFAAGIGAALRRAYGLGDAVEFAALLAELDAAGDGKNLPPHNASTDATPELPKLQIEILRRSI